MRRIPHSVAIGGMKFSIKVRKLDDGDFGQMHFDDRTILLNKAYAGSEAIVETLRHEMIHASLAVSGVSFSKRYDEEAIVRALESIFFPAWDKLKTKLNEQ